MERIKHLCKVLNTELHQDNDRSCVIVAASILEQLLGDVLRQRLVPNGSSQDTLFDGPNAPVGTFSSRIDLAHRIGLVSNRLARDLHLLRRIRNVFAHSIEGCTFANSGVRDQVDELVRSLNLPGRDPGLSVAPYDTTKGHFVLAVMLIISNMIAMIDRKADPIQAAPEEACYTAPIDIKREGAN